MTRFNSYLLNENRSKEITQDEATKLIKDNCSDIIKQYEKSTNRIYRGKHGTSSDYQLVTPGKGTQRMSRNTRNYYTLLMDNLPAWKFYPKRSRSIVCSTNKYKANEYGTLYVVLPYNKAKIGVCLQEDIWDSSYENFNINLMEFNIFLQGLLTASTKQNNINFDKNWKSLTNIFKDSEARIQSLSWYYKDNNQFVKKIFEPIQNGKSYIEVLNKIINPNKLNIKLETPKTINLKNQIEVWVSKSSSILIKADIFETYFIS